MVKPKKDRVLMLTEYWLSAEYMRQLTHALRDEWAAEPKDHWPKFRTYAAYWLSALYVVVEGFRELKLDERMVPEITSEHVKRLKKFRNGSFHFQRNRKKQVQFLGMGEGEWDALDWAERLHVQLKIFFRDHLVAGTGG
jgi:hypothetical protein